MLGSKPSKPMTMTFFDKQRIPRLGSFRGSGLGSFGLTFAAKLGQNLKKSDRELIPEDQQEYLFEPFYRVDRSRSRKTGGYGLGLSISRRIMEAHDGTITVSNNTVRGATFLLIFPRAAARLDQVS